MSAEQFDGVLWPLLRTVASLLSTYLGKGRGLQKYIKLTKN